ncbi:hypothetical protein ABI924_24270 [Chromobacterium phragmitis]
MLRHLKAHLGNTLSADMLAGAVKTFRFELYSKPGSADEALPAPNGTEVIQSLDVFKITCDLYRAEGKHYDEIVTFFVAGRSWAQDGLLHDDARRRLELFCRQERNDARAYALRYAVLAALDALPG